MKSKHNALSGKDWIKKFCKSLKGYVMKVLNFEKKKMLPLTNKEYISYCNQENCHICGRNLE